MRDGERLRSVGGALALGVAATALVMAPQPPGGSPSTGTGLPAAATTRAQSYPLLRDSAHRSVAPPYPWQGALPIQQQADPRITPGQPELAAPGVQNGPPTVVPGRPGAPRERVSEPTHLSPMGSTALVVDPDTLAFHGDGRLPIGGTLATVKALPRGGEELYLRLPAAGRLPRTCADSAVDVTLLRGGATLVVDGTPVPVSPGTHAALPARTAVELRCTAAAPCLLLLHSDGPWRPRYLDPEEAPRPEPPPPVRR